LSELKRKKQLHREAVSIAKECEISIENLEELKNGLAIRCLNKKLLTTVLKYVGEEAKYVCKYWFLLYNNKEL